jgi:hypothetical protein
MGSIFPTPPAALTLGKDQILTVTKPEVEQLEIGVR